MSEVRMCDNCGTLFSVNARGWTQYTVQRNVNNAINHGAETRHMGPECQPLDGKTPTPRVEMPVVDRRAVGEGIRDE